MEPNVGLRLRALREQQRLSLRELAERCGLSFNAISRIERGENSPTVSTLHLLASALHVPITAFFEAGEEQALVVVRREARLRSTGNGITMESLGIGLRNQQIEPFLVTVDPQARTGDAPVSHAGEEFVYCVAGSITYRINDEWYELQAGDSLLFEASQPHCFRNTGTAPAQILIVFQSADGKQLLGKHLHETG